MTTRLRQRWLLAVLVAGQFMANVDIAIVNVATPSIHRDLHASGGALEFVVSGYVLAFAMLIITGARLGRIAGYRRVYLAGLAGFTLASLACSLAPGTGALIGARIARTSTYFAMLFVLAQYLQQGLGRSATYSGLVLVSWVAAFGIAAPVTRRLPARVAPSGGVLGSLILASAFAAVSAAPAPGPFLIVALGAGGFGLGMAYSSLLGRLTAAVPPDEAADLSGLVNTSAQVSAVAGVAAYGTVYFALAARPAYAFAVVTATLGASGFAGAACSFLSARRRAAEVPTARAGERVPARSGSPG
jgi:MFS family permease